MHQHRATMKPLLVHADHRLDAVTIELTFAVSFSEEGSNRRRDELRTQMHWRDLLQDLEGWQCCTLNRSVDAVETRCDTSILHYDHVTTSHHASFLPAWQKTEQQK